MDTLDATLPYADRLIADCDTIAAEIKMRLTYLTDHVEEALTASGPRNLTVVLMANEVELKLLAEGH